MRSRGSVTKTGLTLGGVAVQPSLHAFARDSHRGGDVCLRPSGLIALDDQQPAKEGGPGVTVRHESLRLAWVLDKPHPNPEALPTSTPYFPLPTSWPNTASTATAVRWVG